VIVAKNLTKKYGDLVAVDSIDLEIRTGEIFGFLGPNGAGKTTTIKMLAGVMEPTAGTILIDGIDLQRNPIEAKHRTGFIPDRPYLYDKLTGMEFLRFIGGLYGLNLERIKKRGGELLEVFELSAYADELIENYSHGMKQRLIMCSAFLHNPKVLVVDEPMVGLDPKGARLVKRLFREFVKNDSAIFMSTHTLEVAEAICDRIAIIHHGRIIALGTMPQLREMAGTTGQLETIFIQLTGGEDEIDVVNVLNDKKPEKAIKDIQQ